MTVEECTAKKLRLSAEFDALTPENKKEYVNSYRKRVREHQIKAQASRIEAAEDKYSHFEKCRCPFDLDSEMWPLSLHEFSEYLINDVPDGKVDKELLVINSLRELAVYAAEQSKHAIVRGGGMPPSRRQDQRTQDVQRGSSWCVRKSG